jgi:hypothetical protein
MNPIKAKLSGTGLATFIFFKDRKPKHPILSFRIDEIVILPK